MKLYEISHEFIALQSMLENGEIDQATFDDTIAAISCEFEDKARNCMMIRRQLEADSEGIATEIDRLLALKKSIDTSADRITNYLRDNMVATGKDKIDLGLFKLTLKKATMVPKVNDESKLPPNLFRVIPESRAVDKAALKAALELGKIEGAELVEGKRALLIK